MIRIPRGPYGMLVAKRVGDEAIIPQRRKRPARESVARTSYHVRSNIKR